ncbi:hypothetical protein [Roseovarius autotrophicus]|uniref:hypothetical protein n=1 Tax=Roseovarius autotrophicus TaxID=2824121 RepID=UPI0019E2E02A|nr:hypothetical protein [Roseovarius autotrophicus]MBE0454614.1 hypothetical protein [Roseovarius sp.]
MRRISLVLMATCGLAAPALGQMGAAEFDALTRGQTFYYGADGAAPYGAEEYLDNRRVRWSFLDGECIDGSWYEEAGRICFVYENRPEPQCWIFERLDGRLVARFDAETTLTDLYELRRSREPLWCQGPEIGV